MGQGMRGRPGDITDRGPEGHARGSGRAFTTGRGNGSLKLLGRLRTGNARGLLRAGKRGPVGHMDPE